MYKRLVCFVAAAITVSAVQAQPWDTVVGEVLTIEDTGPHWFAVRSGDTAYLVDGDAGKVRGTLQMSNFSPAVRPHMAENRIYTYGAFYTRNTYGERTDVVIGYDASTTIPVTEIEIPAKSAGIGHSGMIGLIDDRFIGVWNVSPAISVSIVDTETETFVTEISTPNCAGVYPVSGGFIMACADGRIQLIELDETGVEIGRRRSESFYDQAVDPVYDYAVPAGDGWMFMSLDGHVFMVTVEGGEVLVSDPWSINPPDSEIPDRNGLVIAPDDDWRIGGRQPFAYNPDTEILVTIMHRGGGQETFEDAGSEIWGFNVPTQRRGYRLSIGDTDSIRSVQLTQDAEPLMIVSVGGNIEIRNPQSGALIRTMEDISGSIENLYVD